MKVLNISVVLVLSILLLIYSLEFRLFILLKKMLKRILPPDLFETFERAGICTSKEIILLSLWDIKKLTKLHDYDIQLARSLVAKGICPETNNAPSFEELSKISTSCLNIDKLLKGGIRRGTISELYGESGSGKTQIAIQTAVQCSANGCVYICTEDLFPIKRFNQINKHINGTHSDRSDKIFVEHLTEIHELLTCLRVRLPQLLNTKKISLIVLDSIAAPFRCENSCYIQRAEELKEVAMLLLKSAQQFNLAVICINQVTGSVDSGNIIPSLGLAWSNMVSYRFLIKRTAVKAKQSTPHENFVRQFQVVHAPDLPDILTEFIVTSNGVENI